MCVLALLPSLAGKAMTSLRDLTKGRCVGTGKGKCLTAPFVGASYQVEEPWVGCREGGQVPLGPLLCSPLARLSLVTSCSAHPGQSPCCSVLSRGLS